MVGATVLGGLIVLVWMILKFGGDVVAPFAKPSIPIKLTTGRADGVAEGSQVYYRGVIVGKVNNIALAANNKEVEITAEVEVTPTLPGNVEALIRLTNFLGGSTGINLELKEGEPPTGQLQRNQQIPTRYIGLDVLPPAFVELATDLKKTSQQIREANLAGDLSKQINKAGQLIDSLNALVGDQKVQTDLKASVAALKSASEKANEIMASAQKFTDSLPKIQEDATGVLSDARATVGKTQKHIDGLAQNVTDRLAQVSATLDHVQSIVNKIDKGEGTIGKLVNDPKLYQNLLETTDQLSSSAKDIHRLLEQWEQEGVSFNLK
jgi:phospholipid/cholesterol/gamma-HCH transport system substrate-binding protein